MVFKSVSELLNLKPGLQIPRIRYWVVPLPATASFLNRLLGPRLDILPSSGRGPHLSSTNFITSAWSWELNPGRRALSTS